jgi:hypothetical protein
VLPDPCSPAADGVASKPANYKHAFLPDVGIVVIPFVADQDDSAIPVPGPVQK